MIDFITDLRDVASWPALFVAVAIVLPRVLGKIPPILQALTFRRLSKALVTKATWSDKEIVSHVIDLMREMNQHLLTGPTNASESAPPVDDKPLADAVESGLGGRPPEQ